MTWMYGYRPTDTAPVFYRVEVVNEDVPEDDSGLAEEGPDLEDEGDEVEGEPD